MSGFPFTRVLQFNIEDELGVYVPLIKGKDIVDLAKRLNANTIILFARDAWGRAYYKSKVALMNSKLRGRDLIEEVVREAKKEGIKVVVMVGHTTNPALYSKHPEWSQRRLNGEVISMDKNPSNLKEKPRWPLMCLNSPFFDTVLREVEEVLEYDIDGILLDSFRYMPDIEGACFCDFCKRKHEEELGRPLPTKAEWDSLSYRKSFLWRYEINVHALRKIKEKVREINPQIVLGYNSHPGGWRGRANKITEMARDCIDVIFAECSETDYQPPGFIAEMVRLSLAMSGGKPVWASRNSFHMCLTTTTTSTVAIKEGLREAFIAGGFPLYLVFSSAFVQDPRVERAVSEVYKEIEKLEDYVAKAEPIKYACILFSNRSRDWGGREYPEIVTDCMRGFYYALLSKHVPITYISDLDLDQGRIQDYKVVILANAQSLSGQAAKELADHVKRGGGLLATYKTSIMDEDGNVLHELQLSELLGVRYRGELIMPWSYVKIEKKHKVTEGFSRGQLVLWGDFDRKFVDRRVPRNLANHVCVEPLNEDGILARVVLPRSEFGSEYENGRASPLAGAETRLSAIIANSLESGKTVYFSGQIGRLFWRIGLEEHLQLIYNAVLWLGGRPPIMAEGPETFEMSAYELGDSMLVHLLNYTCNQRILARPPAISEKFIFCTMDSVHPMREIVPISDIRLIIYGREVKRAFSLLRDGVNYEVERLGEVTVVRIPRLDEYEAVLLE
ncbi:MAG: hypothetical protein DRJ51_04780 [Thermoprotei archaeon]|nr:MAG: hypothetical protein DRJ51_04780 [Thermoprotei archaeon]